MLFARRRPLPWPERLRDLVWPRCGYRRAARYSWLRIKRSSGSRHAIAIGVAAGVFAAFVPLLGLQMALASLIALSMRGSVVAALVGTFVGTPITYPFMWIASYRLGAWLLGYELVRLEGGARHVWHLIRSGAHDVSGPAADVLNRALTPTLIGGCLIGLAAAVATYYGVSALLARMPAHASSVRLGGHAG